MTRITFYTANGSPTPSKALEEAKLALLGMFGGATLTSGEGIWRECDSCKPAEESSLTITVLAECSQYDAKWQAAQVAHRLREIFDQTEVLYSIESLDYIGRSKPQPKLEPNRWMGGVTIPPGL